MAKIWVGAHKQHLVGAKKQQVALLFLVLVWGPKNRQTTKIYTPDGGRLPLGDADLGAGMGLVLVHRSREKRSNLENV